MLQDDHRESAVLAETEAELIRAAQAGNFAAFGRLVQPFERQMLALAAGIARHRDEADDIYQDALLLAFRGMPGFKADSRFSTWLHRIVVNTALSRKRRLKRFMRYVTEVQQAADDAVDEPLCSDLARPEAALLNDELSRQLQKAMRVLTPPP